MFPLTILVVSGGITACLVPLSANGRVGFPIIRRPAGPVLDAELVMREGERERAASREVVREGCAVIERVNKPGLERTGRQSLVGLVWPRNVGDQIRHSRGRLENGSGAPGAPYPRRRAEGCYSVYSDEVATTGSCISCEEKTNPFLSSEAHKVIKHSIICRSPKANARKLSR